MLQKSLHNLQEFYRKISFLYCFWAIKDINLLRNVASVTELNVNLSRFSWTALIASTLGWFLHFVIAFRAGWSILSDNGLAFCDSGKLTGFLIVGRGGEGAWGDAPHPTIFFEPPPSFPHQNWCLPWGTPPLKNEAPHLKTPHPSPHWKVEHPSMKWFLEKAQIVT